MAVEKTLPHFTTIIYKTSDGENCSATKNNGVVTIQGDKNGVRQMPLDDFMPYFIEDQSKIKLDKTPQKDTVSFSGNNTTPENQAKNMYAPKLKLKPTNKPIIKYTDKDGEKLMAREVQLENGYTCMAVSNEKNPNQTTLMNKDEFQKFFII